MCTPAGFCLDPGKIISIIGPQQPIRCQQIDLVGQEGDGRVAGQIFLFHGQDHIQLVLLKIGLPMVVLTYLVIVGLIPIFLPY